PDRPLPAGEISPVAAHVAAAAALLGVVALLLLARHDFLSIVIAAAATLLLALYSPWLKDRGVAGPAAIALLTLLAVLWGGGGGAPPGRGLLPGLRAGPVHSAGDGVKRLEAGRGDRAVGGGAGVVRGAAPAVRRVPRPPLPAALLLLPVPAT